MGAIIESSAIIESFKLHAEAVSAQVQRVATKELALQWIVSLLHEEGVDNKPNCHAVWAACPLIGVAERRKLEDAVPGLKFDVTRELAAEAKAGVSQIDWGLADTGTLVQDATNVDKRLVSTLPPLHVAIVPTAALLPDLAAVFKRIDPCKSAYLSFITGPSRTADIERVLTIGVHGPERLVIILVDDLEVAA